MKTALGRRWMVRSRSHRWTFPPLGDSVPQRRSRLLRFLGRQVFRLVGWRLEGEVPDLPKQLFIWAPHTSYWDFFLCQLAMHTTGLDLRWMGNRYLFWWPQGIVLRWLGGFPVDPDVPHGMVDRVVAKYREEDRFIVALAPEGTRRKVDRWRTGFHRIARQAEVPIVLLYLDYGKKVFRFGECFHVTGDMEADIAYLRTRYSGVRARRPERA